MDQAGVFSPPAIAPRVVPSNSDCCRPAIARDGVEIGAACSAAHKALKTKEELSRYYYKFLMLRPGRCNAKPFMVSQMMPGGHRSKKMEISP
jgi:hypothetical protein